MLGQEEIRLRDYILINFEKYCDLSDDRLIKICNVLKAYNLNDVLLVDFLRRFGLDKDDFFLIYDLIFNEENRELMLYDVNEYNGFNLVK